MPKKPARSPNPVTTSNTLTPFPEKGNPQGSRIESAAAAQSIYHTLFNADKVSAWNRAQVAGMIDGNPPYPRGQNRRQGRAYATNLDFGEGGATIDASLSAYYDLIEGTDVLARHKLPPQLEDREEMENVIDEEMERMERQDWGSFYPRFDVNSKEFVTHGVSLCYFPDDDDWKWDSGGLDDFLFPRGTRVSEDEAEVLIGIREMPAHKVYKWIEDEETAKRLGWDIDAVREELVAATKGWKSRQKWSDHWTEVQKMLKNNDFGVSYSGGDAKTVRLIHLWVREFSGKVSHYIISGETQATNKNFLYQKRDRFEAANQAFVIFTNGVGNGQIHSIRGLGFRIYPAIMEMNQLRCRTLDHMKLASTLIFKRGANAKLDEPALAINGAMGVLAADADIAQTSITDKSESLIRVGQELSNLLQNNTGNYRPRGVNIGTQEKTKYEVQQQQELENRLNVSQVNLFYRSWGKLRKEVFRRVRKIGPNQLPRKDGSLRFPEVAEFYRRCAERGVPPEVIDMVQDVYSERAIGNGSPGQRQAQLDRIMQIQGSFDERSRNHVLRDYVTAVLGDRSRVDRFVPKPQEMKPVFDEKLALMENNDMMLQQPAERLVDENDAIHGQIHVKAIEDSVAKLEQLRNSGAAMDVQTVMPDLGFLELAIPHAIEHVQAMSQDTLRAPLFGQLRQALQQSQAAYFTYLRQAEQILSEQKQHAQDQADQSGQPESEDRKLKWTELQDKLRRMWVETKTTLQMKEAAFTQQLEHRRVAADQKLAAQVRKDAAKAPLTR